VFNVSTKSNTVKVIRETVCWGQVRISVRGQLILNTHIFAGAMAKLFCNNIKLVQKILMPTEPKNIINIGIGGQSTLGAKTLLPENICMKNYKNLNFT